MRILQATRDPHLIIDTRYSSSAQGLVAALLPVSLAETHQRYCTENQADRKNYCSADYLEENWWDYELNFPNKTRSRIPEVYFFINITLIW